MSDPQRVKPFRGGDFSRNTSLVRGIYQCIRRRVSYWARHALARTVSSVGPGRLEDGNGLWGSTWLPTLVIWWLALFLLKVYSTVVKKFRVRWLQMDAKAGLPVAVFVLLATIFFFAALFLM